MSDDVPILSRPAPRDLETRLAGWADCGACGERVVFSNEHETRCGCGGLVLSGEPKIEGDAEIVHYEIGVPIRRAAFWEP